MIFIYLFYNNLGYYYLSCLSYLFELSLHYMPKFLVYLLYFPVLYTFQDPTEKNSELRQLDHYQSYTVTLDILFTFNSKIKWIIGL